jgi:hypothetical protein
VGSTDFIREWTSKAVDKATRLVDALADVDTLGKRDKRWDTTQGLYHMGRDCVNHTLRHLLQVVVPWIAEAEMGRFDETMREAIARIVGILPNEAGEEGTRKRMDLPLRYNGLGGLPLAGHAKAAYIGTLHSLAGRLVGWFPDLSPADFPGLQEAHHELKTMLEEGGGDTSILPSLRAVVEGTPLNPTPEREESTPRDEALGAEEDKKKDKKLGWRLHEAQHNMKRQTVTGDDAYLKKFALTHVSTPTGADFLTLPFTNPLTRVGCTHYRLGVRQYLGLHTTSEVCNIDPCNGTEVPPYGAHSHHVRRAITTRHDELRDDLWRALHRTPGLLTHDVHKERWMHEFYELRPGCVKDGTGERFDLAVTNRTSGHMTVMDVVVSHPPLDGAPEGRKIGAQTRQWRPRRGASTRCTASGTCTRGMWSPSPSRRTTPGRRRLSTTSSRWRMRRRGRSSRGWGRSSSAQCGSWWPRRLFEDREDCCLSSTGAMGTVPFFED